MKTWIVILILLLHGCNESAKSGHSNSAPDSPASLSKADVKNKSLPILNKVIRKDSKQTIQLSVNFSSQSDDEWYYSQAEGLDFKGKSRVMLSAYSLDMNLGVPAIRTANGEIWSPWKPMERNLEANNKERIVFKPTIIPIDIDSIQFRNQGASQEEVHFRMFIFQ